MADEKSPLMFGRRKIYTAYEQVTEHNVVAIVDAAMSEHAANSAEIDYLWRYMRGQQPILKREKEIRPEITNRIVENRAYEIVQFWSGWLMGEPCTYVRRGDRSGASKEIQLLNDYMFSEDKDALDEELVTWMCIGGTGYRMALPDRKGAEDDAPFEIDVLDPRNTFIVYNNGFARKKLLSCQIVKRMVGDEQVEIRCVYTDTHYFEIIGGEVTSRPHMLGEIPVTEYVLDESRMGVFEAAIPMLDAINTVESNRVDGIEQFVQSLLVATNVDFEDGVTANEIRQSGMIKLKSTNEFKAEFEILSEQLDQMQTQTLIDYMYQTVLTICGVPTTNRAQGGSSDNGVAVQLRQGWEQSEARARKIEKHFKSAERAFLKLIVWMIRQKEPFDLRLMDIDIVFSRRNTADLITKSQSLLSMLEAGINPEDSIGTCGLWNDPLDVYTKSLPFLMAGLYH